MLDLYWKSPSSGLAFIVLKGDIQASEVGKHLLVQPNCGAYEHSNDWYRNTFLKV